MHSEGFEPKKLKDHRKKISLCRNLANNLPLMQLISGCMEKKLNITQLIRKRNKLERKARAYEKERDYLLKSLADLKPPKKEDLEEILRLDLEIKRLTISLHSRNQT